MLVLSRWLLCLQDSRCLFPTEVGSPKLRPTRRQRLGRQNCAAIEHYKCGWLHYITLFFELRRMTLFFWVTAIAHACNLLN